jgi:ketol-acid reductoisomerase
MQKLLSNIQDGSFAEQWIQENKTGRPNFNRMRAQDVEHPIELVGGTLRRMMPFVNPKEVVPGQGGA